MARPLPFERHDAGNLERLPELANELMQLAVDVLVCIASPAVADLRCSGSLPEPLACARTVGVKSMFSVALGAAQRMCRNNLRCGCDGMDKKERLSAIDADHLRCDDGLATFLPIR